MRIGFFVWEYSPSLVGGLGTYADYITREFISMGNDVTVFTLNPGKLKSARAHISLRSVRQLSMYFESFFFFAQRS